MFSKNDNTEVNPMTLKKIASVFAAVLAVASMSAAAGRFSFGLKAGIMSAKMVTADTDLVWSAVWRPVGGFFVTIPLGEWFYIQPELIYASKGATYSLTDGTTIFTATVAAPYVDIPILLKMYLPTGSGDGLRPNVYAGPYLGFKAGTGKMKMDVTYGGQSTTSEEALTSLKKTDFGIILGAGVDFPMGSTLLTIDVRWGTSLSTISTEGDDTRNKAWTFLLGFAFN
jgi:hypothetical protein